MKTIQMTIEETLLADVDRTVHERGINRSAFIREALQLALRRHTLAKLEARHAAGYAAHPATADDMAEDEDDWESLRAWGEA
jgi:metal-responsive CopG/Arc/MetJ family transcriptional regulator